MSQQLFLDNTDLWIMHWVVLVFLQGTEVSTTLYAEAKRTEYTSYFSAHTIITHCLHLAWSALSRHLQLLKSHMAIKVYFRCHLFTISSMPSHHYQQQLGVSFPFSLDIYGLPHAITIRRQYNVIVKKFGLWNQRKQDSSPC